MVVKTCIDVHLGDWIKTLPEALLCVKHRKSIEGESGFI